MEYGIEAVELLESVDECGDAGILGVEQSSPFILTHNT